MKAIQLFMLAALAASAPARASEAGDTVAVVNNPSIITVKTTDSTNSIIIAGREDEPDFRLKYESSTNSGPETEIESLWAFNSRFTKNSGKDKKQRKRRNPSADGMCDFYAGAVIPTSADPGINKTGWEIGMLNVAKMQWRLSRCGTELSIGVGWHYRHLTIGDGLMASRGDNGAYTIAPIPADYSDVKSTLRNFAVQFPVALNQRLSGNFTVEIAGVAMLNSYTTGNASWSIAGTKSKTPLKNLHQRILTVDALARVGWKDTFAVYVRYSPMSLFDRQYGPQYQCVSVGASLGF